MQTDSHKLQPEIIQTFLNNNLLNYFKKKDYSIDGIPTCSDIYGLPYSAYCFIKQGDINLGETLAWMIKSVDAVIDELISDKDKLGQSEIHWRKYPQVKIYEDLKEPKINVIFRISVHHKP